MNSQADMASEVWTWWGLLRRREEPATIRRRELLAIFFPASATLLACWLVLVALDPTNALISRVLGSWSALFLIPAILLALPIALTVVLPGFAYRRSFLAAWVAFCREQGSLRTWDHTIAVIAAATVAVGSLTRLEIRCWPVAVALAVAAFASAAAMRLLSADEFAFTRKPVEWPPWLEPEAVEPAPAPEPAPDPSPTPGPVVAPLPVAPDMREEVYQFKTEASDAGSIESHKLTARMSLTLLNQLREINRAHGGRLYIEDPTAVITGSGREVDRRGRSELDLFCGQIIIAVRKAGLSPYQTAASILRFVQEAITYEYDGPSTRRLLGEAFDEYGRFPMETLMDRVGDCECTAILCSALLSRCGFDSAFLQAPGHLAVGLRYRPELFRFPLDAETLARALVRDDNTGYEYLYGETAVDADDASGLGFGYVPDGMGPVYVAAHVPAGA